ncbi:MAG: hypothetical protein ACR2KV_17965 [Solirubrobacteraceae bacterium]
MPEQPERMPELPDEVFGEQEGLSRSGSPDWGGVDLSLGDKADATQNSEAQKSARDEAAAKQ